MLPISSALLTCLIHVLAPVGLLAQMMDTLPLISFTLSRGVLTVK